MRISTLVLLGTILVVNGASIQEQWKVFKEKNGKQYRSRLEETKRLQIFTENLRKIEEHNKRFDLGEVSYSLAVNKFADLTDEEFKARLNPQPIADVQHPTVYTSVEESDVPDEIDWGQKGAVTRVKDQGNCGGCWAFASVGALESRYFLNSGELISFSEQFLIDCSINNYGCNGGWALNAYRDIRNIGMVTEESYPYEGSDGSCSANGTFFKDIGFAAVQQDEIVMKTVVANEGPIAVAIDASYLSLYAGGVFDSSSCSNISTNHVVLITGYGTTRNGIDYWLVKNSWGSDWGEEGYLKMSRNKESQCGIATQPFYPVF